KADDAYRPAPGEPATTSGTGKPSAGRGWGWWRARVLWRSPAGPRSNEDDGMTTVLLIIHLMIAAALVGVVLLQRSEGGALGIGGGGGFRTGRGAANFLTRVTASLAAAFFATSLLLTLLASRSTAPG